MCKLIKDYVSEQVSEQGRSKTKNLGVGRGVNLPPCVTLAIQPCSNHYIVLKNNTLLLSSAAGPKLMEAFTLPA